MQNEFTAVIERDGDWYIAYCPEIPGANGQGRTKDEARDSLADAIALILEDRPPLDMGHLDEAPLGVNVKEKPPVADPAAKGGWLVAESLNISA